MEQFQERKHNDSNIHHNAEITINIVRNAAKHRVFLDKEVISHFELNRMGLNAVFESIDGIETLQNEKHSIRPLCPTH